MDLDYSLPHLLVLLGAIQGLIFAMILCLKAKHKADYFLGLFVLTLVYNGFETFSAFSGLSGYFHFFDYFSFTVIFLSGPGLYFYIRSVLLPQEKLQKSAVMKHMVPFATMLLLNLALFTIVTLINAGSISISWDISKVYIMLGRIAEPLSILAFIFYLILSIRLYIKTSKKQGQAGPVSKKGAVKPWIKAVLITVSVFAFIWSTVFLFPAIFSTLGINQYYAIDLGLTYFIYWVSFGAHLKMQQVHSQLKKTKSSSISVKEAEAIMTQLKALMLERKPYLDPKISRESLAREIALNPKTISSILNQHHGLSFNEFINGYRIEEVKVQLKSPKRKTRTITSIALDAGFNSQATFQRVFKSSVGMSPKEYVAQNLSEVDN